MLIAAVIFEVLLMVALPVALAFVLRRRWGLPWMILIGGVVAFIASQVVHLPLNAGLTALFRFEWMPKPPVDWALPFNAIVLGLTAGLCEELARYFVLHFWLKEARGWREAIWFGAGHGGIESILTGLTVAVMLASMIAMHELDMSQLPVPPDQQALAAQQVEAFWSMPLYMPLLAVLERAMAIILHLALSTLVMRVFTRGKVWYLFAAIGLHALFNAIAVYVAATWGAIAAEAVLGVLTVGSVAILWWARRASKIGEVQGAG